MSGSRRAAFAAGLAVGGSLAATWPFRAALRSAAARAASRRRPNAATRRGIRIDLGPARGRWTRGALAADLGPTLSDVLGVTVEAAAYSRFGDFALGRPYSAYLDPTSPYYQAWLGAYVVFDTSAESSGSAPAESPVSAPARPAFGFDAAGNVRTDDVLAAIDADQRLVYASLGCELRFPDGWCVRQLGEPTVEHLTVDGDEWWRITGQAETWSTCFPGGHPWAKRLGRWLYGVAPRDPGNQEGGFPRIRCAAEVWLRHDPAIQGSCAAFLVAPLREPTRPAAAPGETSRPAGGVEVSSEPLLLAARSLLRQVSFHARAVV